MNTVRLFGKKFSRLLAAYYLGPNHPSKLRIWNFFNKMLGYPRLTVPFGGKGWVSLDIRDVLDFWVLRDGDYEPEVWEALTEFGDKSEVVWDIGAHIGIFSLRAAQDPIVSSVHSFEAYPLHFCALNANHRLNNQPSNWQLHPVALSDREERRTFYGGSHNNSGLAGFLSTFSKDSLDVNCKTIDALVAEGVPCPTLLKLDVEGWELNVLRGGTKLLTSPGLKAIVFEAECYPPETKIKSVELVAFLNKLGWRCRHIPRPTGEVSLRENYIAFRDRTLP